MKWTVPIGARLLTPSSYIDDLDGSPFSQVSKVGDSTGSLAQNPVDFECGVVALAEYNVEAINSML